MRAGVIQSPITPVRPQPGSRVILGARFSGLHPELFTFTALRAPLKPVHLVEDVAEVLLEERAHHGHRFLLALDRGDETQHPQHQHCDSEGGI